MLLLYKIIYKILFHTTYLPEWTSRHDECWQVLFCNVKTLETLVKLKQLKFKKCTLRPPCCVYMHDRYAFVLVNVETLLYMDHLLTTHLGTHHTRIYNFKYIFWKICFKNHVNIIFH